MLMFLEANFLNEMGPCRGLCWQRCYTQDIECFYTQVSCGKFFFINKAIQRTEPGNLVASHTAEAASVAVDSCCYLLMRVTVACFNCVLHRS